MRTSPRRSPITLILALTVASISGLLGCAEDDAPAPDPGEPRPGGSLELAATGPARHFDPILARGFAERLVARQVSEPLLARSQEPFVAPGSRESAGLAIRAAPTDGATVWRIELREGVRFQDGARLDAAAVLANAARWQTLGAPAAAGLLGADSPKPGLVRFILAAPDRGFGSSLAAPELGLVSPRAIEADGTIEPGTASGSGAYELVARAPGRIELRRYDNWWGGPLELGPGFEEILLHREGSRGALAALERGEVKLAGELDPPELDGAARDPLLGAAGGADSGTMLRLAVERSLRGIDDETDLPALSGAWSTELAG